MRTPRSRILDALTLTAFLVGLFLLGLDLWGLAAPNDQRTEDELSYGQAIEHLESLTGADSEIVAGLNEIVHQAMYRGLLPGGEMRIPARQNWILHALAWTDPLLPELGLTNLPDLFSSYQMTDPERALRRGFGICSQQSLVLSGLLMDRFSIPADVVNLGGHVVVQAHPRDHGTMLADPLHGVVLDFGLEAAENNPSAVAEAYPEDSYAPALYTPEGNLVLPGGPRGFNPKLYRLEQASYTLIWVIPGLLMLPWLLRMAFRRKR